MTQGLADFLEVFTDINKTAVMGVLLIVSAFFRMKGYIDGPGFVDLVRTTTIAYFSTTAASHFTSMVKDNLTNKLEAIKNQVTGKTTS